MLYLVETNGSRISTHSPRVGRTLQVLRVILHIAHFNSLAPCGANLGFEFLVLTGEVFQLTRPVWGEPFAMRSTTTFLKISTHSPRVGRTNLFVRCRRTTKLFQLTRPVWGEPYYWAKQCQYFGISTHSPRVGRTLHAVLFQGRRSKFQLTRPVWGEPRNCVREVEVQTISTHSPRVGRTRRIRRSYIASSISTHSPRVGRTSRCRTAAKAGRNFNSLAPCGANRRRHSDQYRRRKFQLTRPVWGEPNSQKQQHQTERISTHSPRVGRTTPNVPISATAINFNSLAPCGANRADGHRARRRQRFQLTRPVWGEPCIDGYVTVRPQISTHSPRVGRTSTYPFS